MDYDPLDCGILLIIIELSSETYLLCYDVKSSMIILTFE